VQTLILIRPHRGGWESFESPGVQPYFPERRMAIEYAQGRTAMRRGEIRILNAAGEVEETIPFDNKAQRF
jgi:hypothetical protein